MRCDTLIGDVQHLCSFGRHELAPLTSELSKLWRLCMQTVLKGSRVLAFGMTFVLAGASVALAQNTRVRQAQTADQSAPAAATSPMARSVPSGQKLKLKGTIVDREADTFVLRDDGGTLT